MKGRKHRLSALAVAALTAAAFLPVLRNGFVNWDDPRTLIDNASYRGFGFVQLRWMFGTRYMGNYQPLSWLSYALDYRLWGLDARGFHLTSLLLHALNAALFFFLAARLLEAGARPSDEIGEGRLVVAAAFAALLFSLHPLRVESVAWASERRDVLSGTFYLACLLAYLKAHASPRARRGWIAASLAALSLSLLAKGSGVVVPAVLLVLDFYPLRRLPAAWPGARDVWLEKALFALPALAIGIVGLFGQVSDGASMTLASYGLGQRLAQAGYALTFYLWKTLIPVGLSPLYLHPSLNSRAPSMVAPALLSIALTAAAVAFGRRRPAVTALWAYYVLVLAPVLGLIPFGMQVAADRYTYLSCLGWALAGGALLRRASRARWASAAAALLLAVLAASTWRQAEVWRNSETLWSQALSVDARNPVAHAELGNALARQGRLDEAIGQFRSALLISPGMAQTWGNLGAAYASQKRYQPAASCLERAHALAPGDPVIEEDLEHLERISPARPHFSTIGP